MPRGQNEYLSKRFQEIMDVAYRQETITAADLEKHLTGEPSNSTVRTQLRQLEERGFLVRVGQEIPFSYRPAKPKQNAAVTAMQKFLNTFFNGSVEQALGTLLTAKETGLTDEEVERLQAMIEAARSEKSK